MLPSNADDEQVVVIAGEQSFNVWKSILCAYPNSYVDSLVSRWRSADDDAISLSSCTAEEFVVLLDFLRRWRDGGVPSSSAGPSHVAGGATRNIPAHFQDDLPARPAA